LSVIRSYCIAHVYRFVHDFLGFDPSSVNIVPMQTEQGVRYRSAFVDINGLVADNVSRPMSQSFICGAIDSLTIRGDDVPGGLHFDNGKRMSHVKVVGAKKHSPSKEPLQLEEGEWTSVYIPVIPEDLTMDNGDVQLTSENGLSEFFEDMLKIGKVSRIDFMTKPIPNTDRVAKCAYVHFDNWYDNHTTKLVRKTIDGKGEFSCNGYYDGFEFQKFERARFITFKVNHKPIPAVTEDMNIHQVASANKALSEANAELQNENKDLKYMFGNAQLKANEYERMYNELLQENAKMKSYTMVPVPGTNVHLDIGPILAENSRLKEAAKNPVSMEQSFKQVRSAIDEYWTVVNNVMPMSENIKEIIDLYQKFALEDLRR
jgi:hypothetical protein